MAIAIHCGDCRDVLGALPSGSVHCCITSPPYFGLRDYGVAGQIGLEPTPDDFVAEMMAVFREVRRVLRDDGTLWLNLGDSYASTVKGSGGAGKSRLGPNRDLQNIGHQKFEPRRFDMQGLKPKDLIGIPWRVAFALQADGWYLRSDIIWAKPNTMPESVTDRPTSAHEHVFLFSKAPKYFYDHKAIMEPVAVLGWNDGTRVYGGKNKTGDDAQHGRITTARTTGRVAGPRVSEDRKDLAGATYDRHRSSIPGGQSLQADPNGLRNARNVWTIPTHPYPEAHFATMAPALAERCILAGCPIGGTVLDPFGGAGTTGLAADRLGRSAILIEINSKYAVMASARIVSDSGLFSHVINHGCAPQAEEAE